MYVCCSVCFYNVCMLFCLFGCLYPINVKTAKPIGPKFLVGPPMILHGLWILKITKSVQKCLIVSILKMRGRILSNPQTFFVIVFYYMEKMLTDKATIIS